MKQQYKFKYGAYLNVIAKVTIDWLRTRQKLFNDYSLTILKPVLHHLLYDNSRLKGFKMDDYASAPIHRVDGSSRNCS